MVNPIERLGSLNTRPNWRFDLLKNPAKYKMQDFISIPSSNAGSLKRFINAGLEYTVNFVLPDYLKDYMKVLNKQEQDVFFALWSREFKRDGKKKIEITTDRQVFSGNPVWNLAKVKTIQDPFLVRVIEHISKFKHDPYIQYAIDLYKSEENREVYRFIGYGIYAKLTDAQLAKRWRVRVKDIEAVRNLFFDFSRFPTDRIANFTYLRQLANIGLFDDVDFMFFKRVFELGDLGIKAQIDYANLTDTERRTVEDFLGKSVIANTLNLNFAVKTYKDAVNYGVIVSNLASYYIKEKEARYLDAKTNNLNAMTRRIEGQLIGEGEDLSNLDKEMIALLREHSLQEHPPLEYKTLEDLKK